MALRKHIKRLPLLRRIRWAPVVAAVRLSGTIGSGSTARSGLSLSALAEPLENAFRVSGVQAVALLINSPGGSPVQSALIAQRIRDLSAEHEVPVYAFCEDVAASGGYWLACAADEIYAMDSSVVGSIGVVSAGFGFQDLIRRHGVERRVHASGERKVMLDPFKDEDPEDVARLERLQEEVHESFKDMVRVRRKGRLKADEAALFTGEFWSGKRAFELGLVDGLGEARRTLRGIFGTRTKFVPISTGGSWLRRRFDAVRAPQAALPHGWADDLVGAVEERAVWQRYGL